MYVCIVFTFQLFNVVMCNLIKDNMEYCSFFFVCVCVVVMLVKNVAVLGLGIIKKKNVN